MALYPEDRTLHNHWYENSKSCIEQQYWKSGIIIEEKMETVLIELGHK
jgi:hypothetical protein